MRWPWTEGGADMPDQAVLRQILHVVQHSSSQLSILGYQPRPPESRIPAQPALGPCFVEAFDDVLPKPQVFHIRMHLVERKHTSKRILPLANPLTTHRKLIGNDLARFSIRQGVEQPSQARLAIPIDEVSRDPLSTGCHHVPPWPPPDGFAPPVRRCPYPTRMH